MTLVEKMARAMCAHDCRTVPEREALEWESEHEFYLGFALAVLKAMREPSDVMVRAHAEEAADLGTWPAQAIADWQAMIDAAIKEAEGE